MIILALIAVFGLFALLMVQVFFLSRRSAWTRVVARDVQEEVAGMLRKDSEATKAVVENIAGGLPVDQVVNANQEARAGILTCDRTDKAWAWDADNLEQWRKAQLRQRTEEVNRKLMVPAVGACLFVLAVCSVYRWPLRNRPLWPRFSARWSVAECNGFLAT